MNAPFRYATLLMACLGLMSAGCWERHSDRPSVYLAGGQLFFHGMPASNAKVELRAPDDKNLDRLRPHAIVQTGGVFQLTTFTTQDGAPAGVYALTITWPSPPKGRFDAEGPDRFKGHYADPRRPVRKVKILPGKNELGRIDLN
jgi:hypothetical protein